jgi:AbrB family looped-hinge helix DNA binding protein
MPLATKVDKMGRILIPAALRRKLSIQSGSQVLLTWDNRQIHLTTPEMALREAQDRVARLVPRHVSLVDELIAERRAEVRRESES